MIRKTPALGTVLLFVIGSLMGFIVLEPDTVSALTTHTPIFINGNSNFTSANGVSGGNGTSADPYIIDGWNITSSTKHSIQMLNTTAHFIIRNVSLDSGISSFYGIYLDNCSNGQIVNTTILNASRGIFLYRSSYINISRSNISNSIYGILLTFDSENNNIMDNEIIDNDWGILVSYSSFNYFKNNSIKYNSNSGLEISWSPFNNITRNYLFKNQVGVYVYYSNNINISENEIISNNEIGVSNLGGRRINISNNNISVNKEGINFNYGRDSNITANQISYNKEQGIYFSNSMTNNISGNTIRNNTDYGILFEDYSESNNIINNRISEHKKDGIRLNIGINNNISHNIISDTEGIGVIFEYSDSNIFMNNDLRNNINGFYIWHSSFSRVENNNISYNANYGIQLSYSYSNEIKSNNIYSNDEEGVAIYHSSQNTINWNNISQNNFGVYLGNGASNTILIDNTIKANNNSAIFCYFADSNNIVNNHLVSNAFDINLSGSRYNKLSGNDMDGTGISFYGTVENFWITNEIDTTNTLNGKPIYFWKNRTKEIMPVDGAGQIILANCTNITISHQDLSYGYTAVTIGFSDGNWINNNTFSANDAYGVYMYKSNENHINNNYIASNRYGLFLDDAKNNLIYNNDIRNSIADGINLKPYSYNNIIKNNTINVNMRNGIAFDDHSADRNIIIKNVINYNSENGIYFYRANSNLILNNIIMLNYENGMVLDRSGRNTILNNTFSWNEKNGLKVIFTSWWNEISNNIFQSNKKTGIYIHDSDQNVIYHNTLNSNKEYGLYLESTRHSIIYHNNFISNNIQAYDDDDWNQWDAEYPLGGNYWNDFIGTDMFRGSSQDIIGEDGICDDVYKVNLQNMDHYPLMMPSDLKPSAPQNLQAVPNDHYINLTWEPPSFTGSFPLIYYRVYRDYESGFYQIAEVEDLTEFNDTKITTGFTYFYKISAVNAMGESPLTEPIEVKARTIIEPKVPTEPLNFKAEPEVDHIMLSWTYPKSDGLRGVTNYRIYKGIFSGGELFFKEVAFGREYKDTDVGVGITYYYQISALNEIGEGPLSEEVYTVIATVPSVPLNLIATPGDSVVDLTWTKPVFDGGWVIEAYIIYRGTISGNLKIHMELGNQTFYRDSFVENGETYYYRVSAKNGYGEGPLTEEVDVIPDIVINLAPMASIKSNITAGPPPLSVAFTGGGLDSDGVIAEYFWDFDDGYTSTEQNPNHTFKSTGTYFVKLTVIDDDGEPATAMITINVAPDSVGPGTGDKPGKSGDTEAENSPWAYAAGATVVFGIILIILLMFVFPMVFKQSERRPAEQTVKKKEISITRVPMKPSQAAAEEPLEDELLSE